MSDDSVPFASHITSRNGVFQYNRRVPKDVADHVPIKRIQVSLKTHDRVIAYELAAKEHARWERTFADARAAAGRERPFLSVDEWTADDWRKAVEWYRLTRLHEDWRDRARNATGEQLAAGKWKAEWTPAHRERVAAWHREGQAIRAATADEYQRNHLARPRAMFGRLGVPLLAGDPHFEDVLGWLRQADVAVWETLWKRERSQAGADAHPDTIVGPWRPAVVVDAVPGTNAVDAAAMNASSSAPSPPSRDSNHIGKTLRDCYVSWLAERDRAGKVTSQSARQEKERSMAEFGQLMPSDDLSEVSRGRMMEWRERMFGTGLKAASVNKRLSDINALMKRAVAKDWIDGWNSDGMHTEPAEGENWREAYDADDLAIIFGHASFTERALDRRVNASVELQVWVPLLSCLHGLITSEILQIGPNQIVTDERTGVRCFEVNTANGRRTKEKARRRVVPVRDELWNLGLKELESRAIDAGWETLWPGMEGTSEIAIRDRATPISNKFSNWWSDHTRKTLGITDREKVLYSFRHSFKDAMRVAGASETEQNLLMGHAEQGVGGRYGTKRKPVQVDTRPLNRFIQNAEWTFLGGMRPLAVPHA